MDETYKQLLTSIRSYMSESKRKRIIVAIAGAPGSGKSTIASEIVRLLNSEEPSSTTLAAVELRAVCVSMDGFHLSRSSLDLLPNKEEAYMRRGAPWTFDIVRALQFVRHLRAWADRAAAIPHGELAEHTLFAPSFDHALGDPVENKVVIPRSTCIVVLEGNYLLLDEPLWRDMAELVHLRVYVDADGEETRERVARRHVAAGIEATLQDAYRRVESNDHLNEILVKEKLSKPDLIIKSITDSRLFGGKHLEQCLF